MRRNVKRVSSHSVCISVLNWNGWRETLACVDSLRPLLPIAHLVICDNASGDDSFLRIQAGLQQRQLACHCFDMQSTAEAPPQARITVLRTAKNGGFAAGHNAVIRYALSQQRFEYFWLLNNDMEIAPRALHALLACAHKRPQVGAFGSTVLEYKQPNIVQCAGGCEYYPWSTVFRSALAGWELDAALCEPDMALDYIYGATMFIRRQALDDIGLLSEAYFLFYEELDFCQRLKQAHYKIAWCRDSHVFHHGGASMKKLGVDDRKALQRTNYYENLSTLKYTARFHPAWLPVALILRFVLKSLAVVARGQSFLLRPLWQAYRDFFKQYIPGIRALKRR
jgi:GT2 family glycosyltransferase